MTHLRKIEGTRWTVALEIALSRVVRHQRPSINWPKPEQAACVRRLAQEAMMPAPRDRLDDVALQYEKLAEGAEAGYHNPE